ncbi:hypothetical protein, partial [Lysobacter sp. N42]|uniref:hypothetical protein n=1 Tax=Lysobacter sp. N42 TaxID=2545719 RepID=UPI001A9D715E
ILYTKCKVYLHISFPIQINHAYSNTMQVITIYNKMNLFKMFPKFSQPVASDLRPFVQSSWRNRIGLLRWRRGLGTTGTANWACNAINNTNEHDGSTMYKENL